MRVSIESKKQTQTSGFIFRKTRHYVSVYVTVDFSDEEMAIIEENDLHDLVVLERDPDLLIYERVKDRGDPPEYWYLRVKHLVKEKPHEYTVATPVQASQYEEDLKDALKNLKAYLEASTVEESPQHFEL